VLAVQAQTTGSITGIVTDTGRGLIPGANVLVTDQAGKTFSAVTNERGSFRIPALNNGLYTVKISAAGFKSAVVENVKVDVNTPATVDVVLEVGSINETVTIQSGAEVLQRETATVGSTVTGRQIIETPIPSRNAMDLISMLPGTATLGRQRSASVNGLPKSALSITIDGVDVQDNFSRSFDGYRTSIIPRLDSIEEATLTSSNPGAESSGDGAVQIRFVTKRGTNNYRGSLFYQHRNEALNSNYWYVNSTKSLGVDENGKALRQKVRLHQYGGSLGGPIPLPRVGDDGGPQFASGRDRAFFFVNYEEFRLPESLARTRTILTPAAQSGIFSYIVGGEPQPRTANLYNIAAANNQLATPDPTVASLLARIRTATATTGSLRAIVNSAGAVSDPNRLLYDFAPVEAQKQKYLTLRFDVNISDKHSVDFVTNRQRSLFEKDFINGVEERFPGFPSYSLVLNQNSYSTAVRSSLSKNIVNEARYTLSTGRLITSGGVSPADFAFQGGYNLGIGAAGITTGTASNTHGDRNSPVADFTDSVTWLTGPHTINFGGQYKRVKLLRSPIPNIVPTVNFGIDATDTVASAMFNATTLPGASNVHLAAARALYATLIGRITGFQTFAILKEDGTYEENARIAQENRQDTFGLWIQDGWKVGPNLTLTYGLRWQPQGAYVMLSKNYTQLSTFDDIYGISGLGNILQPGVMTGRVPTVVGMKRGEKAFTDDRNNFAPAVGAVWSPNFGRGGFFKNVFGGPGKSVLRAGYSLSFIREGTSLIQSIFGLNPGPTLNATRNVTNGNLIVGTNLRDPNNPNLTAAPFPNTPSYPLTFRFGSDLANVFDSKIKTGSVASFSLGYQREIDRDTVVEIRYMGNRGIKLWRQHNINEVNTIENGFAAEFRLAQQNLYANIAAGRTPVSFAYFGPGTGTNPLPIILSYFNMAASYDPVNPARYLAANFTNTDLVAQLSANNPQVIAFATSSFASNLGRHTNGIANGRPANFFYVNPATGPGGAWIVDNSADSSYDAGVIEFRRRLSNGLRIQASYVYSKALSDSFQSNTDILADFVHRDFGRKLARNVAVFDTRHQFKFDATFDLPFGRGARFLSNADGVAGALVGGWSILPVIRWQSGSPFSLGNVQLVGMTAKDLQKAIKVRKGPNVVTFLPDDIILNTQRAFDIIVNGSGGYGTTYGGPPTGRFIAPAGYGNCHSRYAGECGFSNLILYGPGFFKFDAALTKKITFGERRSVDIRATFLDILNRPNFRIGGWAGDVVSSTVGVSTFGQLPSGSAYQDLSTTNDSGGRLIDLMIRFRF
jgi:hypothetical protein